MRTQAAKTTKWVQSTWTWPIARWRPLLRLETVCVWGLLLPHIHHLAECIESVKCTEHIWRRSTSKSTGVLGTLVVAWWVVRRSTVYCWNTGSSDWWDVGLRVRAALWLTARVTIEHSSGWGYKSFRVPFSEDLITSFTRVDTAVIYFTLQIWWDMATYLFTLLYQTDMLC